MAILVLALPIGIYLVQQAQVFLPRAVGEAITVLAGDCVTVKDGKQALLCGNVPLSIISPIGPPGSIPSATPSLTPSGSASTPPSASPSGPPNGSPTPIPTHTVNATPPPGTGLIKGTVFKDFNGNGVIDGTDTHLSGSPVYLQDQTGTITYGVFNSDQGGNYGFFNIGPGNYRVTYYAPLGYTLTTENSKTFTLGNGAVFIHNFGLKPDATSPTVTPSPSGSASPSISPSASPTGAPGGPTPVPVHTVNAESPRGANTVKGTVFKDYNGTGIIDGTDTELQNSPVYLQDLTGTKTYAIFNSDGGGNYGFFNVGDGDYRVTHYEPWGYTKTTDNSRTFTVGQGSVFIHNFGLKPDAAMAPNSLFPKLLGFVIGNVYAQTETFSISGTVFIDYNANGLVDSDDKRLPNEKVTLELYDTFIESTRHPIGETSTDSEGNYKFMNLTPVITHVPAETTGGYRVTHYVPAGFRKTTDDSHYPVRQDPNNPTANVTKLFGFTPNPECSDKLDNDGDSLIDEADPVCHTDGNAGNPASYNPDGPTEGEPPVDISYTICYRVAETQADLGISECIPYTEEPTLINHQLLDDSPGQKQIWVRFEGVTNGVPKIQDEHINIELLEKDPTVTSVDCTLDLSSKNLKVTLKGEKFGEDKGTVTANKTLLDILSWNSTEVSGILRGTNVPVETGQKYTIILTRKDGKILPEQICRVDTGLISLGARVFCREPGKFDVENVKINLVAEDNSKVEETVTIDKEGIIGNLKTKLQSGKKYVLSIKAPYSLRRNATFTAAAGTSVVTAPDGGPFILPIGDIAPVIKQDGKINTLDRSLLSTQWRVLGTAKTVQTGDFNRDTKVNSVDWACMRYDFDKSDDPIPTSAAASSSPAPSSGSGGNTILSSPSPSANTQLASFNLSTASNTVSVGNEFQVKVNLRSDTDSANLLSAKLSFPKDLVSVVKIEDAGSLATNIVEKFFDNSTGQISIVGGTPNPGVKTSGSDGLFATIFFKANAPGSAPLNFGNDSAIFRNSDNQNILGSKNGLTITINE